LVKDESWRGELLVVGHRNPDTDASTSAVALAALLNSTGILPGKAVAAVLGELPPQARFVFQQAGLEEPPLVEHLRPRVSQLMTCDLETLTPEDTLGLALEKLISSGHSMLPVVDNHGRLQCVFSHRRDIFKYLLGFSVVPLLGQFFTWTQLGELNGIERYDRSGVPEQLDGELVLAWDQDPNWSESIGDEDLLVCASLASWRKIESVRRPRRVILIQGESDGKEPVPDSLLLWPATFPDLVHSLQTNLKLASLELGKGTLLGFDDEIKDVEELILLSAHALPVVDSSGVLRGVMARSDLNRKNRQKVVLVDHFETSQAVPGLDNAEVVGVFDHHRVGDVETLSPILVDCRPVGSSCTLVALRYQEAGLHPEPSICRLLLGGLCSDTLALRSPTTTDIDRRTAQALSDRLGINFDEFALSVLKAGDDLLTADVEKIWNRDQKHFTYLSRELSVAQLETVSLQSLSAEKLEQFRKCLEAHHRSSGELFSMLFITDVIESTSWAVGFGQDEASALLELAFGGQRTETGFQVLDSIVSRKKQVLPKILKCLSEVL
jgi:manganese-dependent inorganic pyrophosphatase